jgi:hypothetical protein
VGHEAGITITPHADEVRACDRTPRAAPADLYRRAAAPTKEAS